MTQETVEHDHESFATGLFQQDIERGMSTYCVYASVQLHIYDMSSFYVI